MTYTACTPLLFCFVGGVVALAKPGERAIAFSGTALRAMVRGGDR
jgi:hypothetical protein